MREGSRHRPSRPGRQGGRAAGPRGESRPGRRQAAPGAGGPDRQGGGRLPSVPAVSPERVTGLVEPVIAGAGMDLESVRVAAVGRRLLLRVVVDADGGVALDDIAEMSRKVGSALDADEVMGEAPYTLEISSPGVDRPLTQPRHWRRAVGRLVRAPFTPGESGRGPAGRPQHGGSVEGRVVAADDGGVTLEIEGARHAFGYGDLGPGKVQVEFGRLTAEPGGPDGGEPDGH